MRFPKNAEKAKPQGSPAALPRKRGGKYEKDLNLTYLFYGFIVLCKYEESKCENIK
jgi:hypothetical protein